MFLPHEVNVFTDKHLFYHKSVRLHNLHIRTAQLDIIKVFYSPTYAQVFVFKTNIIYFFNLH
jgi:hypothetical protein